MNCEDVQRELASGNVDPGLRHAVTSHVDACPACRDIRFFLARVDEALRLAPVWEPPAGFAQRVAAPAAPLAAAHVHRFVPDPLTVARFVATDLLARVGWMFRSRAWVLRQYCALLFAR
jgi:hypothetical protein